MSTLTVDSVLSQVQGDSSQQLHHELRRLIEHGRIPAGEALPSERDLARRLRLARGTVRQALALLEEDGLIDCSHGRVRRVSSRNPKAKGLMVSTIALLATLPRPEEIPGFTPAWDPYIQIHAGKRLEAQGYHLLAINPRTLGSDASGLLSDRPAGVMAMHEVGESPMGRELLSTLSKAGLPVVVYGDSPELSGLDHVASDHQQGAYELSRWLVERGCKRVLRLWRFPQQHHWVTQRDAGYVQAMREAGLPVLEAVRTPELEHDVEHRDQFEHVVRVLAGYLYEHVVTAGEPVDAVMTATDSHAVEIAAALRYLGKKPNEDVKLVGYDHAWPQVPSAQWEPAGPLATMDKNNAALAEAMVKLLLDRVGGSAEPAAQHVRLAPTLVCLEKSSI